MPRENNFLLGYGERLSARVDVPRGGDEKHPPYDFSLAKRRISSRLETTAAELDQVPQEACPRGEVVALLTLHPRYVAKSDFPTELLQTAGLRSIGSRPRTVKPESWGIKKHPDEAVTEELFVAGPKSSFTAWAANVAGWSESTRGAMHLTHLENVTPFRVADKLRSIPEEPQVAMLEVVLHNGKSEDVIRAFAAYAEQLNARLLIERRRDVT